MARKMKDSGIAEIGAVPAEWKIFRIKFLLKDGIKSGPYGSSLKGKTLSTGEYPIYNQANVINGSFSLRRHYVSQANYEKMESYHIHVGDILFTMMGSVGRCCQVPENIPDGIIDSHLFEARLNKLMLPQFFMYGYDKDNCSVVIDQFTRMMNGSIMDGLNGGLIKNASLPLPPLEEQSTIISYLNCRCSSIDRTIFTTRQSIEKLEEYKASLITKAVTKGLNPMVEMQEVAEDWIGKMPEHWKYMRTKYLFEILKRIAGKKGYDILAITQQGIKVKDISTNKGQIAADYSKYQLVYPGDFAMNHMDLLTGWVDLSDKMGVTSPDYRVFCKCSPLVYDKYYRYVFQNLYTTRVYYGLAQGVAEVGRKRLQAPTFRNFKLPVPPLDEQKAIVAYLDKETAAIDRLIAQKQQLIEKFTEYKQSLIYAAVTGKIDCREEASK